MSSVWTKLAMAGMAAVASSALGGVIYRHMRYQKIKPKPLKAFDELRPDDTRELHLTAHRGLSAVFPENTAEAFTAAGKAGFYAIECDTHCTTDGVWVVLHDGQIKTMFDGKGDVKSYSYPEMLEKKMVNGANIENYPNAHICTLQEYIDICKTYGCRPMIEVKDRRIEKMQSLYDLLAQNGILKSCIIISFHISVLRKLREIDQDLEMWYLVEYITGKTIAAAKEIHAGVAFCAQYNAPRPEAIKQIHDAGLTAACWTVDSKELLEKMMDAGVHYVTTNSILPTSAAREKVTASENR